MSAAAVTQAVQAQAQVVPAGNSFDGDIELAIQVGRTTTAAKQVAGWWIPAPDGPVQLGTLAAVEVQSVEATTIARSDGRPALSVNILKETDADAVEISHLITERLPGIAAGLGQNATIQVVFDQAPSIEQSIEDLAVEGSLGLAFAVLIILVFLMSVRSTIIIAISIPLSLLIALIGLQVGGYSLNIFTLAAMTVAVGRVVDDSIVVIENIKRRDTGPNPLTPDDIIASVREVAGAVTASTLTTVAVFVPVAVVSGITGELFRPFSTTVALALTASLLVSLTIVPVLAYWFLGSRKRSAARAERGVVHDEDHVTRLQRGYLPVLNLVLRRPLISAAAALVIFVATVASTSLLKTDFLESFADKTTLQIDQELPLGTRLSTTSDAAAQVEQILAASPGVKEYLTTVGQGGTNRASMFVSLTGEDAYDATLAELESAFAELDDAAGEVKVGSINTGTSNDLQITVTGDDPEDLQATAERVETTLSTTPGLVDVGSDLSDQRPVLRVDVDKRKAAAVGFTQAEVGQAIANALRGTQVGTVVLAGESRDIMVKPQNADEASPKQIAALLLPVSQLQQQQATERATDRLEDKQDALTERGDQLSEDGDALTDRQEDLADRQADAAEEQQDKAVEAAADQRAELRRSLREARGGLADARRARAAARVPNPGPPPARPTALTGLPADQAQVAYLQQLEAWQLAADAYGRYVQLGAGVDQARAQVEQLDEQLDAAVEQADESAEQRAQQEDFADEQENLGDEQKALGEEQEDLADAQSDLAEEQGDIADVRAKPIRVSAIAKVSTELAPSAVTQIDGIRAVTLTATPDVEDLGTLTQTVQSRLDGLSGVPAGVSIDLGGASDDQAEAFRELGVAMLLAIVLVFLIMVATFRSLVQPLILLTSIPFAATGALIGLLVTDTALGVPAMVGLLMLIGIVVTNAIVLIDLINKKRETGEPLRSAVVHGARLRLRPIIMTATATICALIPMGLGLTGGGAFISQPLAVVVIGGLVSSTVLTLLLVPVLYTLVESRGEKKRLRGEQPDQPAEEPAPA